MANEELSSSQAQQIDTSQPTPIKGMVIKGVKKLETVKCLKPGGEDGEDKIITVNKADYNEEVHGKLVTEKLPTRKKSKKKKAAKEAAPTADVE